MEQEKRDALRSKFYPYQKQRILVYGTGKVAERILDALYDFMHIAGDSVSCNQERVFSRSQEGGLLYLYSCTGFCPWEMGHV